MSLGKELTKEIRIYGVDNGRGSWANTLCSEAADRIEALEGVLADIMQYDLRGILPPDTLQRMEDMKVVI